MNATAHAEPERGVTPARAPSPAALWAIAVAGVAASATSAAVAMTTERTTEPEWQAGLFAWIVLTYTVCGAIAWWRRPDSRFGPLMIAAGNRGQHERLFRAVGRPDIAAQSSHDEREALYDKQTEELQKIIAQRTADEWEQYLQSSHVPAGRVRRLSESLEDPQLRARNVLHRHEKIDGIEGPVTVPLAAFKFAHGGPSIETPPPRLGQHTDEVLASLGYSSADIAALRAEGAI